MALLLRWLCASALVAASAAQEDEERSVLLLYKKMEPMEDFTVGQTINVTLSVFNKGERAAL